LGEVKAASRMLLEEPSDGRSVVARGGRDCRGDVNSEGASDSLVRPKYRLQPLYEGFLWTADNCVPGLRPNRFVRQKNGAGFLRSKTEETAGQGQRPGRNHFGLSRSENWRPNREGENAKRYTGPRTLEGQGREETPVFNALKAWAFGPANHVTVPDGRLPMRG